MPVLLWSAGVLVIGTDNERSVGCFGQFIKIRKIFVDGRIPLHYGFRIEICLLLFECTRQKNRNQDRAVRRIGEILAQFWM